MPAAPCTSGSTITAATSPACSRQQALHVGRASPGSALSVSNRSGRYIEWKRSMPPTDTEPIVSPW